MNAVGTLRSAPRRIRDSIEQEGLWPFLLRLVVSPVYRSGLLRTDPIARDLPPPPPGTTARLVTEADVDKLVALRPVDNPRALQERLRRGHRCFVASVDGSTAACAWGRTNAASLDHVRLLLPLRPNEVFAYWWYTDPRYRRAGAVRAAGFPFRAHYHQQGADTTLSFATLGRKPWGMNDPYRVAIIRVLRLGPLRKYWVRTYGPEAESWRERLSKELRWLK